MHRFARMILPVCLFLGCAGQPALTKAEYESRLRTACTDTDNWLKQPKDAKLLEQAVKDCQDLSETCRETAFEQTESMKALKLMQVALVLCKGALEHGVAPEVVPEGLASQSPADSVRQAKEMVEGQLSGQPSPSPTPR